VVKLAVGVTTTVVAVGRMGVQAPRDAVAVGVQTTRAVGVQTGELLACTTTLTDRALEGVGTAS